MKNAYFAGGCFWCISNVFTSVEGVKDVVSGYSGGKEINPAYDEVKHQQTGHRETIKIIYDENVVSFRKLLEIFFDNIDPYDKDGQFIDRGHSYTLAIYFNNQEEEKNTNEFINEKQKLSKKKIQISIEKFDVFYEAEEYHQKWSEKHPQEFIEELKDSGRLK
mgnify:CR=1 FL=1